MRERQNYYDLDSPVYLFGIPTGIFLAELGIAIVVIFMGNATFAKVAITVGVVVIFHLTMAALFRWSPNWIEKALEYLGMPYTPVYKDNVAWVPGDREFEQKK